MLHTFKPIYLIEVHRRLRPCFHKTLRRLPRSLERPSNLQIFLQTWKGLRRNHHPRRQQRQQRALLLHLRMPQENEKERQQVSDGWETSGGGAVRVETDRKKKKRKISLTATKRKFSQQADSGIHANHTKHDLFIFGQVLSVKRNLV